MIAVIDCGLSSLKLSLIDEHGSSIEVATERYPTRYAAERAEQDPGDWWRALVRAASRLQRRSKIRALVATGHMHGLVLLGARSRPLLPCLTLHDRRGAELMSDLDPDWFYTKTGQLLDASLPITKLLWLRQARPELLARATCLLAPKDYLRLLLTGERHTEHVDAAGTGLYDLAARGWSPELVALTGIPPSALAPIVESASVSGRLTGKAATALGLPTRIPVVAGAGDDVELLGATRHRGGMAVEHVGTTGSILVRAERAGVDPAGRVEISPTCVPHIFAAGGSTSNAGSVISWIEEKLDVSLEDAVRARGNHLVALPYLFGERATVRLPFASGAVLGLGAATDRSDVAHSLLVGVAFGLRDLFELLSSLVGRIDELVSSGLGSSSPDWVRLRAAAYGMPISVVSSDPTAVGCAAIAIAALDGDNPEQVALAFSADRATLEPDARIVDEMQDAFHRYQELRNTLLPLYVAAGREAGDRSTEVLSR